MLFRSIGASNFWCGLSPMQIWQNQGYTVYNCGTLMQEIWYSYYFLEEIYKTQTPNVLIFDVDVLFVEQTDMIDNINSTVRDTLFWNLPVMEYHNRWKNLSTEDFTTEVKNTNQDLMKGFYYTNKIQAYEDTEFMDQDFQNEEITLLDKFYLAKIQALCEKHGTKLVLMEAPAERAWNEVRRDKVVDYANQHGLDFMDSNSADIGIEWETDSRDGGFHLNYNGAKKFTAYVEDYLVEKCQLEDHRNDSAYSDWNKDLVKYQETVSSET